MENSKPSVSTNKINQSNQKKEKKKIKKKIGYKIKNSVSNYSFGLPTKLWRKFISKRKQTRINKRIDNELKNDCKPYKHILIMGDKGSGKTTICKQIRQIYGNGFSIDERKTFIKIIEQNLYKAIIQILDDLTPSTKLQNPQNEMNIQFLQNYKPGSNSLKFFNALQSLWGDSIIQNLIISSQEDEEIKFTKYFFENLGEYGKNDYVPSLDDVMHCYETTNALLELKFKSCNYDYNIVEIPNLKCNKWLWKHMINDISAVVYVINCSSFDKITNSGKNYFEECIEELHKIHRHIWLSSTTFVVFLNKVDEFCKKIQNTNVKLETCFPEYLSFKTSDREDIQDEVTRAKMFIKNKFLSNLPYLDEVSCRCVWYLYYVCALNTNDLQLLLNECTSYIGRAHLCILNLI